MLEGFVLKTTTQQGFPVAVGGLCQKGTASEQKKRLSAIDEIIYPQPCDLYAVDSILARKMKALALPSLLIVGATICIPGIPLPTGGILGNPHEEATSASGVLEEVLPGIYLITLPAGPGIALWTSYDQAQGLLEKMHSLAIKDSALRFARVQDMLSQTEIDQYILVSDGSGPGQKGEIIVFQSRQLLKEKL